MYRIFSRTRLCPFFLTVSSTLGVREKRISISLFLFVCSFYFFFSFVLYFIFWTRTQLSQLRGAELRWNATRRSPFCCVSLFFWHRHTSHKKGSAQLFYSINSSLSHKSSPFIPLNFFPPPFFGLMPQFTTSEFCQSTLLRGLVLAPVRRRLCHTLTILSTSILRLRGGFP